MINYYFGLLFVGLLIIFIGLTCFNYYNVVGPLVCYVVGTMLMAFAVINIIRGIWWLLSITLLKWKLIPLIINGYLQFVSKREGIKW